MRCIPPGIQQMPAHHAHQHHHDHARLYTIDPEAGDLFPPQPPRPPHRPALHPHSGSPHGPAPAAPEPRAEPARMAAAPAARGHGAALAPQAQGLRAEPAREAEEARDWDRDWEAILDPLGGEAPPPGDGGVRMAERGLLGDHQGDEEPVFRCRAPPEGRGEQGGARRGVGGPERAHESVLRAVIWAGWPDRELTWPAFLEGGGGAPRQGRRGQQLASLGPAHCPHPLALPLAEPAPAAAPAPSQAAAQVTAAPGRDGPGRWGQGAGEEPATRDTPLAGPGPRPRAPPPTPRHLAKRRDARRPQ